MIDRETVVWLYRCILNREPETEQVIDFMSKAFSSIEEASRSFLISDEYMMRARRPYVYSPENNNAPCPSHIKQRLALASIMKNEEDRILNMLRSVVPIVGFVSLIDTGSTDHSVSVAQGFLEECDVQYSIRYAPFENFSKSRNASLDNVADLFQWILILDADEYLVPDDYWRIAGLLDGNVDGWELPRMNYTDEKKIRPVFPYPDRQRRLIRNRTTNKVRYSGHVHESPKGIEEWGQAPIMSDRFGGQRGGPHIHHTGQIITPERFKEKDNFYKKLMLGNDS